MGNGISNRGESMEKQITMEYLDKLGDEIWEVKKREKNNRYSDREIYLNSLLDYIDRIQAVIEKGEI